MIQAEAVFCVVKMNNLQLMTFGTIKPDGDVIQIGKWSKYLNSLGDISLKTSNVKMNCGPIRSFKGSPKSVCFVSWRL